MTQNKFDEFVKSNLPKVLQKNTEQSLGDRSSYVGSSDIGSCLRKAYLDKTTDIQYDISTLIRFQRGHIAEQIVEAMLSGLNPTTQLEIETLLDGAKLKAHIDFALESKDEIIVVEAKSINTALEKPYTSWLYQVQYQMALLSKVQNKKVRAYIVAINLNTGWFKSFVVEANKALADIALSKAKILADALNSKTEPKAEEQLYCSTCPHKSTCPLMFNGSVEAKGSVLDTAKKLIELNLQKKAIEKELEEKKEEIVAFMKSSDTKKLQVENHFISLSKDSTSVSFDEKTLKEKEPELYNNLFEKYQKISSRKGYLSIK